MSSLRVVLSSLIGAWGAAAALLLLAFASLASLADAQTAPTVVFADAQPVIIQRSYPTCAYDVTAAGQNSTTVGMWAFGGLSAAGYNQNFDYSTTGVFGVGLAQFGLTGTVNGSTTTLMSLNRLAAIAGVLGNGNLIFGAGKVAPNGVRANDVYYSTNQGTTWTLSTAAAAFLPRSDASYAALPGAGQTTIVMAGGTVGSDSNAVQEVWVSRDGTGATWTRATNATSFGFTDSAMTFLYSTTGSTPLLVLYAGSNIYTSPDVGTTWSNGTALGQFTNGATPPTYGNAMVADSSNNLYLTGYSGQLVGNSEIWFSATRAATWTILLQTFSSQQATTIITLQSALFACLGITYSKSANAAGGSYIQPNLAIYSGTTLTADTNSIVVNGSNWCPTTVTGAADELGSLLANIVLSGQSNNNPDVAAVPNSVGGGQPAMVFHDAGSPASLGLAAYSTCAYDVHALLNLTTPRMWQLGGFTSSYSFINTVSFTSTGNWSQGTSYAVTTPGGRVAGAAGVMFNGRFLYMGGKSQNNGSGSNDVYVSMNNGQTFSLVTAAAAWTSRSDLSVAFFPGTNLVMIAGGATTGGGGTLNDIWVCQDGVGAVWTQATPLPTSAFSDAGMVALYDASATQKYSTVVIAEASTSVVYTSTDFGTTWQAASSQPWTNRYANTLSADADNYIYAAGGQNGDGNVYFSWDKAHTWAILQQYAFTSTWSVSTTYLYSHYSCQAIRYIPTTSAASPALAHKQLIIYGGGGAGVGASSITTVAFGGCNASSVTVVYGEILFPPTVTCLTTGACALQPVQASSTAGGAAAAGSSAAPGATSTAASAVSAATTPTSAAAPGASSPAASAAAGTAATSTPAAATSTPAAATSVAGQATSVQAPATSPAAASAAPTAAPTSAPAPVSTTSQVTAAGAGSTAQPILNAASTNSPASSTLGLALTLTVLVATALLLASAQ